MTAAYYNEIDLYVAQWLRNLIAAGHIAPGDVDERDIRDVRPGDLGGYAQCHFFAGIGVWSYAARRAGWPDDRPLWTGSCPCQPFSAAGKGGGFDDERHLWPAFFHLISECHPAIVLGEQVASRDGLHWLDLVQDDLEGAGYAFGAVDTCSAGHGAPHIRQRLRFVANAGLSESSSWRQATWRPEPSERSLVGGCSSGGLVFSDGDGREPGQPTASTAGHRDPAVAASCRDWLGPTNGFWRDADWLRCRDGKWRPIEPGTFPLAHGAPTRVGRLRAYGNAVDAQATEAFVRAVMT